MRPPVAQWLDLPAGRQGTELITGSEREMEIYLHFDRTNQLYGVI